MIFANPTLTITIRRHADSVHCLVGFRPGQDGKGNMETYEIWKNGNLFAAFEHGDPSRFGLTFNREVAGKEFDSCVAHWTRKGVKAEWELRIRKPNSV